MLPILESFQSFWSIFSEGKMQGDSNCWFKAVDCTDPNIRGRLSLSKNGLVFSSTEPEVVFNIKMFHVTWTCFSLILHNSKR